MSTSPGPGRRSGWFRPGHVTPAPGRLPSTPWLRSRPPSSRRSCTGTFSHRNLLWLDGRISGVVDWVETSTGPAWLDAAHAATNLAVAYGSEPARSFLAAYAALTGTRPDPYWLIMDAVGFLPPPGQEPLLGSAEELERLDEGVRPVVGSEVLL